jgi:hypothetical protein
MSQYNSVGIATGHRLDGWGSILDRDKIFLFSVASRPTLGPIQPPMQLVPGVLSAGVKQPGPETDHSTPSRRQE